MNIEYLYRNKTMQLQLVKDYSSLISYVGCTALLTLSLFKAQLHKN